MNSLFVALLVICLRWMGTLSVCVRAAVIKDDLPPSPHANLGLVSLWSYCRLLFRFQVVMPTADQVNLGVVQCVLEYRRACTRMTVCVAMAIHQL